jgi:ribose 5-phosphate isomerase B
MANGADRESIRRYVREALEQKGQNEAAANAGVGPLAAENEVIDESVKDVITEADLRAIPQGKKILIREDALITPAARDLIRERDLVIQVRRRRASAGVKVIGIGADHGGYEMKEQVKKLLDELGYRHRDFGTFSEEAVDYPDFAHAVARAVADGKCDLGIIVDGAGIGSCMTANKVPGVRAALCYDEATARNSREHNYANVLTLGGRMIDRDRMRRIVQTWLETPEGEARHGKRVDKIMAIERQYLR